MVEFDRGVAWVSLAIANIHPHVAQQFIIQWSLATVHNTGSMVDHQLRYASCKAIPALKHVDVEKSYSYSASIINASNCYVGNNTSPQYTFPLVYVSF